MELIDQYMVFLMKVKTEQNGTKTPTQSTMSNTYDQIRATDLSAILFKGNFQTLNFFSN